jgi:hypothetical protein
VITGLEVSVMPIVIAESNHRALVILGDGSRVYFCGLIGDAMNLL